MKPAAILVCLSLMFVAALTPGCGAGTQATLIYATDRAIPTLDPATANSAASYREIYVMYDRLFTLDGADPNPQKQLVSDYRVSPDRLVYTFTLRQGVKFHDGAPLDAAAVKYSFERMLRLQKEPARIFTGILERDRSIVVIDPTTVEFRLVQPFEPFIAALAMPACSVINPRLVDAHAQGNDSGVAWLAANEAGSGPYALTDWQHDKDLTMTAFADYWGIKPKIPTVVIKVVDNSATRQGMLVDGDADIIDGLTDPTCDRILTDEGSEIVIPEATGPSIIYLAFNTQRGVFADVSVRRSVARSINRSRLLQVVGGGHAIPLASPVPKGMTGYDATLAAQAYQPGEAKAALPQSAADGAPVVLMVAEFTQWVHYATELQKDLELAGLKVELKSYSWPLFLSHVYAGEADLALMGWTSDYADPDQNTRMLLHSANAGRGGNLAFYRNPQMDDLLDGMRREVDSVKRAALLRDINRLASEDCPYYWLAQPTVRLPMGKWVQGFTQNPVLAWYVPFQTLSKARGK